MFPTTRSSPYNYGVDFRQLFGIISLVMSKKSKKMWVMWGYSESGDHYDKVILNHEPTEQDKTNYIKNETPEDLDIGGPGFGGSYVYLKFQECKSF